MIIISVLAALALSSINAVSAVIIARKAMKKEHVKFIKAVFGSMVIRYFFTVILVWVALKVIDLDRLAFSLTFLISTFILLIAEILYLNYRSNLLSLRNDLLK